VEIDEYGPLYETDVGQAFYLSVNRRAGDITLLGEFGGCLRFGQSLEDLSASFVGEGSE
jgi:hypothetical protein